jgi:hypothetical protein
MIVNIGPNCVYRGIWSDIAYKFQKRLVMSYNQEVCTYKKRSGMKNEYR